MGCLGRVCSWRARAGLSPALGSASGSQARAPVAGPGSLPNGNPLPKPPLATSGNRAQPPEDGPSLFLFSFLMGAKGSKGQGCSREQGGVWTMEAKDE